MSRFELTATQRLEQQLQAADEAFIKSIIEAYVAEYRSIIEAAAMQAVEESTTSLEERLTARFYKHHDLYADQLNLQVVLQIAGEVHEFNRRKTDG